MVNPKFAAPNLLWRSFAAKENVSLLIGLVFRCNVHMLFCKFLHVLFDQEREKATGIVFGFYSFSHFTMTK